MFSHLFSDWLRWVGGQPEFRIYGKGRPEAAWRIIDVYATSRRSRDSRWPLWQATCITWTAEVIVVGRDFARAILHQQHSAPASREFPQLVAGGRLGDPQRRAAAGGPPFPTISEVLAHEGGHTWQALRLGPAYLPLVGSVTFFGEGPHPWNRFENEASEQGQFGGLVIGSVQPSLMDDLLST